MRIGTLLLLALLLLVAGCPKPATDTAATDSAAVATSDTPGADAAHDEAGHAESAGGHAEEMEVDPATTPAGMLVGQAAPDFTLTDLDGKEHHLADYTAQGKVVIVEWFSPKCGAVNAYYAKPEFMQAMHQELDGKEVVWLAINSSGEGKPGYDPAENKDWLTKHGKNEPVLVDASGATGKAYGVENTPHVFVIGKDGKVAYSGGFDEAAGGAEAPKGNNHVVAAVNASLDNQPAPVTVTRAVG
jgi:peroxiredoxin